ncbi:hypothetical protein F4825DRAFT_156141 [Nemania diffusa]|nr:hypothetical protein F4825DRAFT_156141 [Nemania diffusa]
MPMKLAVKRNTRSTAGGSNELFPVPTLGTMANGTESKTTAVASVPQTNRRVFYHHEQEDIIYRDSSVPFSSHSNTNSNAGDIRSSSRPISLQANDYNPNNPNADGQDATSKGDDIANDQQSTQPIPADFDRPPIFGSSPPSRTRQDAPVTRNRARAQALAISKQTKSSKPVDSSNKPEDPKSKTIDHEYEPTSPSACQDQPIRGARGAQSRRINGLDGSAEGDTSTNGENPADLGPEIKSSKANTDEDDDEYELPESENDSNSEISIIREIRQPHKGTANKNPSKATYSSRPKGKQIDKARTARPANTNKTTVSAHSRVSNSDHAILSPKKYDVLLNDTAHQTVTVPTESSDQGALDLIPESQDVVEDSQRSMSPVKPSSSTSKVRRPKKPFYTDDLGTQSKPKLATSAFSNNGAHQQSTTRKGKVNPLSADKNDRRGDRAFQNTDQNKVTGFDRYQSKAKRQREKNNFKLGASEVNGRFISHNGISSTKNEINESPNILTSDEDLQFTDGDSGDMCQQSSRSYQRQTEADITRHSGSRPSEQPARKSKSSHIMRESVNNTDASTQASVARLISSPVQFGRVGGKNGGIKTDILVADPLPQSLYHQGNPQKSAIGDDIAGHWSLRSPQFNATGEHSWTKPIIAKVGRQCHGVGKPDRFPSAKNFVDFSTTEEPLHPNSRVWAQGVAKRIRQKNLVSESPAMTEETEPLGLTPIMAQETRKDPISKRDVALGARRNAVSSSIQEVTTAVLRYLQSKESTIDNIVEMYQRNGHELIHVLLARQSMELHQAISAFDKKCRQLGNSFEESARHVKAIDKRASKEVNRHFRDWVRRSEDTNEAVKMAREAIASI